MTGTGLTRHAELRILEVIDLLSNTRHTFRSKQIERARQLLEELVGVRAEPANVRPQP